MTALEVTVDGVDWSFGNSTLLYDPKFLFPPDNLLALARDHARCPGLVHRGLRCGMDREAVARLFGLDGVGVGRSGGSASTAGSAADGGTTTEGGGVLDSGDSTSTTGLAADGGTEGGDSGDSASTSGVAADGRETEGATVGSDQEPAGYFTVEESEELDYIMVATADEIERERRLEAGAEAALEAGGLNDRVRSAPDQHLEEAQTELTARKASGRVQ